MDRRRRGANAVRETEVRLACEEMASENRNSRIAEFAIVGTMSFSIYEKGTAEKVRREQAGKD